MLRRTELLTEAPNLILARVNTNRETPRTTVSWLGFSLVRTATTDAKTKRLRVSTNTTCMSMGVHYRKINGMLDSHNPPRPGPFGPRTLQPNA